MAPGHRSPPTEWRRLCHDQFEVRAGRGCQDMAVTGIAFHSVDWRLESIHSGFGENGGAILPLITCNV